MGRELCYSICLIPEKNTEAYSTLSKIIYGLSVRYRGPNFVPHLTIAGSFVGPNIGGAMGHDEKLDSKAREMASRIRPFQVTLTGVGYLDEMWRSLFAQVDPSTQLVDAINIGRETFDLPKLYDDNFLHLSLMYGMHPRETKERIKKEIEEIFPLRFGVDAIYLTHNNERDLVWTVMNRYPINQTPE